MLYNYMYYIIFISGSLEEIALLVTVGNSPHHLMLPVQASPGLGYSVRVVFRSSMHRSDSLQAPNRQTSSDILKCVRIRRSVFKFFIRGGISSDIQSEISFYGDASASPSDLPETA